MTTGGLIDFRADVKEVERWLTNLERKQVPYATRRALKSTADHIAKKTLPRYVHRVFDRPTKWTERGFYGYQPRDKRLVAYVNIKDGGTNDIFAAARGGKIGTPAFKYLKTQISGGGRGAKSHEKKLRALGILSSDEYTVPGEEMRLNRFGNLTGTTYSKILADVQGSNVGISQGFGQATTKRGKKKYFYSPNLKPRGIYIRTGRRTLKVALLFVKSPSYTKRFDFHGTVQRVARKQFPIEWRRWMQRAIDTAR